MDKTIKKIKNIALVAHDNMKDELLDWAKFNKGTIAKHHLFATGTTGSLLEEVLDTGINKMQSGPLGGDLQLGALISEGKIDFLIFSGTRWKHNRMILILRHFCVLRRFGIFQ